MPAPTSSPWQRRLRRLFLFVGTASTFYVLSSYIVDRMREARIKAIREKRQRDLMKNHFTSLISTISFTLYALLPTLQPQVFEAYPVESTSQALQGLSTTSLSASTSSAETSEREQESPENSLYLHRSGQHEHHSQDHERDQHTAHEDVRNGKDSGKSHSPSTSVQGTESWASEFRRGSSNNGEETESEVLIGSSIGQPETDDGMSSIVSHSISLPPTDTSSNSPSPPSEHSHSAQLDSSPSSAPPISKSKKELWKDLKAQSLTRTITTIYLLPMLYLLTSSQLAILARNRYLQDVETSVAATSTHSSAELEYEDGLQTPRRSLSQATLTADDHPPASNKKRGWLPSFSVDAMGLSEFVDGSTFLLPNPVSLLPTAVTKYLPAFVRPSPTVNRSRSITRDLDEQEIRRAEMQSAKAEAERLFLTYSWWLLHEGWKPVASRVDLAVGKVFGNMPLKKDLTGADWEQGLKEVRAEVEMELSRAGTVELYDFTPHLIPTTIPHASHLPFPSHPSDHSPYLASLVDETISHIRSPDGRYLLEKGIAALSANLLDTLKSELYTPPGGFGENEVQTQRDRKLVHCLPEINRWGKGVWEGVPDSGVEAMLAVPEFEGFAALVFGDWAPK
ncbi:hypothetical protein IAR55_000883 [Kwoniella newhampshirensis]|uniref:Peroxin-3 n=1 Tax=Kwoniella newhampshirensis TaxID=1651941 RepID=A0AAW0Z469_9TREE